MGNTELCISVDDLPAHGPLHSMRGREDVVTTFLYSLSKHQITGAAGFLNGGMLEPRLITSILGWKGPTMLRDKLTHTASRLGFESASYLNGQFPDSSPSYLGFLTAWVAAGHCLGNHNYWHSSLNSVNADTFIAGIQKNQNLIERITHQRTRLFRFPYLREGNTLEKREAVRNYLASQNYLIAPVTVCFKDWAWNCSFARLQHTASKGKLQRFENTYLALAEYALVTAKQTSERLFGRDIKHILLLHLGAYTSLMLDKLLTRYRSMGVRFISMEEALTDPIYSEPVDFAFTTEARPLLQQLQLARNEKLFARRV